MLGKPKRPLKRCPLCFATAFYVGDENMVFFRIDEHGAAVNLDPPSATVDLATGAEIYCTQCAWHGAPAELLPPQ